MSKELEVLNELKQSIEYKGGDFYCANESRLNIIEVALKRLEELEKEHNRLLSDYQELVHCGLKSEQKKLKAFEIIKKKMLYIDFKLLLASTDYEIYCFWVCNKELTKEEYELLREVLL